MSSRGEGVLYPAMPRPHGTGSTGERAAGSLAGRQHRLLPRFARPPRTGEQTPEVGTGYRRRHRQSDIGREPAGPLGCVGRELPFVSAMPSARRLALDLFADMSGRMWQGGRLPPQPGRTAQRVENQDRQSQLHHAARRWRPTSTRRTSNATSCSSSRCAAAISSTPRSTATMIGSAWHTWHADGGADAPQRHGAVRVERSRHRRTGYRG